MDPIGPKRGWIHAPGRYYKEPGMYCLTAATLGHRLIFTEGALPLLHSDLLAAISEAKWRALVWCVFPNHYHLVAEIGEEATSIRQVVSKFHSRTARLVNHRDSQPGRKVWFNYWESMLFNEAQVSSRCAYVHHNAVRHGIVEDARDYPFCSAGCGVELDSGARLLNWKAIRFDADVRDWKG